MPLAPGTGRREAIWEIASYWGVLMEYSYLDFDKEDEARWEGEWVDEERMKLRAGLTQVIEMTEEEWEEEVREEVTGPKQLKRKNTLTPRAPCCGSTPQAGRRATIPSLPTSIPNITTVETASV